MPLRKGPTMGGALRGGKRAPATWSEPQPKGPKPPKKASPKPIKASGLGGISIHIGGWGS